MIKSGFIKFVSIALVLGMLFGCGEKNLDSEEANNTVATEEDTLLPSAEKLLEEEKANEKDEIDINDLNSETPSSTEKDIVSKDNETKTEENPQQNVIKQENQQPVKQNPTVSTQEPLKQQETSPAKEEPKEEVKPEPKPEPKPEVNPPATSNAPVNEKRAVWISYLDFGSLLKGKSEGQFSANIDAAFDKVKYLGLNTVIVQVRPFGDALYKSEYFPWSKYASGTEGVSPGYDPLKIMTTKARQKGLKIEAWINPYRVRTNGSFAELSNNNPAKLWQGTDKVIEFNGGIYYNPSNESSRQLIVDGVSEIVRNYDIDAIHFDDYFYPTTSEAFDQSSYNASGTSLSLADWRRENVNKLVRAVYSEIKSIKPSCQFGISPQSSIEKNYNVQYVDAAKWLSTPGYVDYIMPQIYHGFSNSKMPFAETVRAWNNLIKTNVKLEIGLSPYKIGVEDKYAGNGRYEWIEEENLLKRMTEFSRTQNSYNGIALFRYDSIVNPQGNVKNAVVKELEALREIF